MFVLIRIKYLETYKYYLGIIIIITHIIDKNGNELHKCPTPIGHYTNNAGQIKAARCKSWNCLYCAQINKKRVLDRVTSGFENQKYVNSFTLTEGSDESSKEISKHWARLRASLQKEFGHHIKFFRVTEFTPDSHLYYNKTQARWMWTVGGRRHYHILTDQYIDYKLLKKLWEKATNDVSHIVWINKKEIKKAAGYNSKYLVKTINDLKFGKHERRYSFSQNDGFVMDDIRKQLQYNYIKPKQGEYIFHLGMPLMDTIEKVESLYGKWTSKGDGGGIYYSKPNWWFGWKDGVGDFIKNYTQGDYLRISEDLLILLTKEMNGAYNRVLERTDHKERDIIQFHYVRYAIQKHNESIIS